MTTPSRRQTRLTEGVIVLFIGGFLALNYPLLAIFDRMALLFGIPVLYLYLFSVWLAIIIIKALLSRIVKPGDTNSAEQTRWRR